MEQVAIWATLYADDAVLLATKTMGFTRGMCSLENFCTTELLRVGYGKTKQLLVNQEVDISTPGKQEQQIGQVDSFDYLGIELHGNSTLIDRRHPSKLIQGCAKLPQPYIKCKAIINVMASIK